MFAFVLLHSWFVLAYFKLILLVLRTSQRCFGFLLPSLASEVAHFILLLADICLIFFLSHSLFPLPFNISSRVPLILKFGLCVCTIGSCWYLLASASSPMSNEVLAETVYLYLHLIKIMNFFKYFQYVSTEQWRLALSDESGEFSIYVGSCTGSMQITFALVLRHSVVGKMISLLSVVNKKSILPLSLF